MRRFRLVHKEARQRCAEFARSCADGMIATFREEARNGDQNAKYHAMIGDIARQFELHGRLWDSESMKRLLVDQFHRDTKNDPDLKQAWLDLGHIEMAPSIDRTGVVVLNFLTRNFSKKLAGAFIEWLFAFGVENGIEWTDE